TDSFLPSGASIDPQVEAQRQAIEAQSRGRDETVFGSGRRVPSGSRVRVAMVLTDLRGQSWYRVELLDDAGMEEDGPPSGWVKENELVGRVRLVLERSGEPPQDPP
ncbi:MAG: hypothetical protein OEQ13_07110, partial [Acidobacteriota bacterium]|nr:hypothetical protein [Acidobacteriota bacterium]